MPQTKTKCQKTMPKTPQEYYKMSYTIITGTILL